MSPAGRKEGKDVMSKLGKALAIAALALFTLTPAASAQRFVGHPYVGFYGGWYGPGWGPGYWYGPAYWGPYAVPNAGEVKIHTDVKDASVYVDGGLAGLAHNLKKFRLQAGTHEIELRAPNGQTFYSQDVEVVAGKTTFIHADYRMG